MSEADSSHTKNVVQSVKTALVKLDGIVEVSSGGNRLWFQALHAATSVLGEIAISLARLEQKL